MPSLSTHVLDSGAGGPRPGIAVAVHDPGGSVVGGGITDGSGRVAALAEGLSVGRYSISWQVGGSFLTDVAVTVELGAERHYHVPLLCAGASAVTYLGA